MINNILLIFALIEMVVIGLFGIIVIFNLIKEAIENIIFDLRADKMSREMDTVRYQTYQERKKIK